MRYFALTLGLGLLAATPAVASYEMLLVADAGNATAGSSRIHRFDPVSKAYLGSFGSGILFGASGVTVDASKGEAIVSDTNGTFVFDYSTGLLKRQLNADLVVATRYLTLTGSHILASGSGLPRYLRSTGAVLTTSTPNFGFTLNVAAIGGDFALMVEYTSTAERLYRYNASTNAYTLLQTGTPASFYYGDALFLPNFLGSPAYVYARGLSGDLNVYPTNAAGTSASPVVARNLSGLDSIFGLAPAHDGFFAVGSLTSDATQRGISQVTSFGVESIPFGTGIMVDPRGMASVVAPEPGTLLALGVGLAALARRRRRKG